MKNPIFLFISIKWKITFCYWSDSINISSMVCHWCMHSAYCWRWHIISYLTHWIEIQKISNGWCTAHQWSCKMDYKKTKIHSFPFSHHHRFDTFSRLYFIINQSHLLVFAHHHHCVDCGSFLNHLPLHISPVAFCLLLSSIQNEIHSWGFQNDICTQKKKRCTHLNA